MMPQICECGEIMTLDDTYHDVVFGSNDRGRLVLRRVYHCPKCKCERLTDGHGKNVGMKGRMA